MTRSMRHRYDPLAWIVVLLLITAGAVFAATETSGDIFSTPDSINARLQSAIAEEQTLEPNADPILRSHLQELAAICRSHLHALENVDRIRKLRDKEKENLAAWKAPTASQPYGIMELDEIRLQQNSLLNALRVSEAHLRLAKTELDSAQYQLSQQQKSARRASESGKTSSASIDRVLSLIAAENIGRLAMRVEAVETEAAMIQTKIEITKLTVAAIVANTIFTQAELEKILARIEKERNAVLVAEKISSNTLNTSLITGWNLEFLNLEESFWKTRFSAYQSTDDNLRKTALATLTDLKTKVDDWITLGSLRLKSDVFLVESVKPDQIDNAVKLASALQQRIELALNELKTGKPRTPLLELIEHQVKNFWQMELYLVEETEVVDGQKIAVYRAVTVGKIVNLIIILVGGIWFLRLFVSWLKRRFLHHRLISPTTAESLGKLVFFFGLILLIIFGLNTARIPLTALAFLGGALAIGFGFGIQTILKNFMSGLILMLEKPIRIGDVVQVAGITGTIKNIGIRASLIQHFDGIETLIPNSILLENELTNWSLSDTKLRHSVAVGVAYGSPTRDVSKLLLSIADEHGLVLEDPKPEVRFEDFGNDALMFRLFFWIDTQKSTGRDVVASDLRFMIDRAFAEAGIIIAYPQRDIHFDSATPLRVSITRNE